MKKSMLFISVLLLSVLVLIGSVSVLAEDEWLYSDHATLGIKVHSSLDIITTNDNFAFDSLTVNLSFIPKNTERQIATVSYSPMPSDLDDSAIFTTSNIGQFKFGYDAVVKTTNNVKRVRDKIDFPYSLPEELKAEIGPYIEPSKRIDSDNAEIIKAASKIAEGEDDYYIVVDKISDFVNKEVTYNLSTLFIKGTKDASWVLRNKEGVCSEITVLFIAMLRSVGIPARFVSGISYTNSPLFAYSFGPHAWAEVYFPNTGWIPYDITYGEFGYIDLGHISMRKTIDAEETSTTYVWKARNVQVNSEDISIDGSIIEKSDAQDVDIIMSLEPAFNKVGFLSYNIITATIKNPNNYYVSKKIRIAKTQDIDFFVKEKQIALLPNEEREIFFIVRTPHLNKGYTYTFPITIYTDQNQTATTKFESTESGKVLSENEMIDLLSDLEARSKTEKKIARKAGLSCFQRDYYADEIINLRCTLSNQGNFYLENLTACIDDDCKITNLGIGRNIKMNFTLSTEKAGTNNLPVIVRNSELTQSSIISLNILDLPKIEIVSVETPENVSFDDLFNVAYTIQRKSLSEPKKIHGTIDVNGEKRNLDIENLNGKFKIESKIKGSELTQASTIIFKINYEDALGRTYEEQTQAQIRLNTLTFTQQVRVLLNKINAYFNGLIS